MLVLWLGWRRIEAGTEFWWKSPLKLSTWYTERRQENKTVMIQVNFVCQGDKWMKLAQYSMQNQALVISGVVIFGIFCINIRISVTYTWVCIDYIHFPKFCSVTFKVVPNRDEVLDSLMSTCAVNISVL